MRTTIDIDDDLLNAAKEIARRERVSAGQVVSRLLRAAFTGQHREDEGGGDGTLTGFRPFAPRGTVVSDELVNALRDQEGV